MQVLRIKDLQNKRLKRQPKLLPEAVDGARVKVLATGCSHCSAMRENTKAAVAELGLPEGSLACISDIAEISRLGVMGTPSLVLDGKLVSCGKVLTVEQIKSLIKEHCPGLAEE